jgi:putative FmdB family regulatory protein
MPIYEYACQACGHEFEEMQKISDPPIRKCPVCGKRKVEKQLSLGSFQLKGGGWYADGYASSNGTSSGGDSAKSDSAKSDSGTKKSESKKDKKDKKSKSSAKAA